MARVSIPNPCGEDWNKMTPTERGAFCGKCQIDVIDFTNKSNAEIKTILLANKGQHLCGHIKQSQLMRLNGNYTLWEHQSARTFQSKFLWACMIAFGLTLFTGCSSNDMDDVIEVGLIEQIDDTLQKDSADYTLSTELGQISCSDDNSGEYSLSTEVKGRFVSGEDSDCKDDIQINGEINLDDDVLIDGLMEIEPLKPDEN